MKRVVLALACCLTAALGFAQAPNLTPGGSYSLWSNSTVPTTAGFADPNPYELGVKFYSDSSGSITAIRFYKGPGNTGTHIAHLWDSQGNLLSTATFTNETASGWQQVTLPNPVPITAGTVYVASYWDPTGHYALNRPYFSAQYNNPPLHALANGSNGADGVYIYNKSTQPTTAYQASNYWVDVVFTVGPTTSQKASTMPGSGSSPTAPTLSSISPTLGPISGGTLVTINGTNFADGATVSFGSAGASSITFVSATQLEAVVPPGPAGNANVTVTNPGGQSTSLANAFVYGSGPTVTSISPDSGSVTGGTTVTITGSGFESGAIVAFGVAPATSVTVVSSTEIEAVTPAESAGTAGVTITNPDSGLGTLPEGFAFLATGLGAGSGPTIATVTPNSNISTGGATIIINGENFVPGATVQFGNTPAASVTYLSPKQLQVVVPAGNPETTVNLTVTNPGGMSTSLRNGFFYGRILFQDGFQAANFSAWTTYWNPSNVSIISSIVHSGSYAAQLFYSLPANAQGTNRDSNDWVEKQFSPSLTHFFIRGYVYFGAPTPGSDTSSVQRKLYFEKDYEGGRWANILTSFGGIDLALAPIPPHDACGQSSDNDISWNLYNFSYNKWYELEMETMLNTPGDRNGYTNVWVNGGQVLNRTGMNIRGCQTDGVSSVDIGNQLDSGGTGPISEYRYWDDIVIADAYIP